MILHNNMNSYDKYVYEGDQPYVFISFSTHDSKIMQEIVYALHNANIRFWYTYHGDAISAGQDWLNELKLKIEKCTHFICVLSKNYEKSAFCMFEFYHAINKNIIPLTKYKGYHYKGYHIDDPIIKLKTDNIQIWDFKKYLNSLNESKSENLRKIFDCCDILQYNNSRYHPLKTYKELRVLKYPKNFEFDYTFSSELMEYPEDFAHDEYFTPHLEQSIALGFGERNEPRPLLKRINFEKRKKKLKFNFVIYRNYGYLDHKAYTSWLLGLHPEYFRLPSDNLDFEDALWSTTGGGVWCITSDRMLIIPKRTFNVSEYPNVIGYSSAGGFSTDITNNNTVIDPFQYMKREIMSELGLKPNNIKFLKLLEIGVDKTRAHVQFSFFSSIDKTKDEIIASHNTCIESDELNLDFIPFTKEAIYKKLYSPEIIKAEPGVIDSLFLIYEYYKEFKKML